METTETFFDTDTLEKGKKYMASAINECSIGNFFKAFYALGAAETYDQSYTGKFETEKLRHHIHEGFGAEYLEKAKKQINEKQYFNAYWSARAAEILVPSYENNSEVQRLKTNSMNGQAAQYFLDAKTEYSLGNISKAKKTLSLAECYNPSYRKDVSVQELKSILNSS